MKVLVTGASGFIGCRLAARLHEAGHRVVAISRNPEVSLRSLPPGSEAFAWGAAPGGGVPGTVPPEALEDVEAMVHLAGENIGKFPWTEARKRAIRDSRVLGMRALATAAAAANPRPGVLVAASAVGWYGEGGEALLAEEQPSGKGFLADTASAWEREIFSARDAGLRVVALRNGVVLGRGGALAKMAMPFRLGLGAVLGSGRQYISWIHLEDAVGAIIQALDNPAMEGAYNCCAPSPVSNREFSAALARVLHRPLLFRIPGAPLRLVMGEMAAETLLASQRASADKLVRSGYRFRFPGLQGALADILDMP